VEKEMKIVKRIKIKNDSDDELVAFITGGSTPLTVS
jgi:hypothetical protein